MDLAEYPRPSRDTGLGIHWSAGPVGVVSLEEIRQRWLPELLAMSIKWVKCLHDGAEGLVEELRANDIMPIVRLYRYQPNPGRLDRELQERVKRLLAAGAVYFEVNNEPNLREEWQPGEWEKASDRLPEIVAEHWIADAEYVLEQGGLPAFPAPTPGGHWDDVDFMRRALAYLADRGRADLFQAGAWLAVHNYFLNHPPDYPYDPINQYGEPLTAEEWERYGFRTPLEAVNQQRRRGRAPGRTLREDSNGFLKYRAYRDIFVEIFGFEVPVMTTEGGAVMGRAQDPRYPPINADLHARYNLFGFTHMADAPDYYFCNCPWLLANALLGHSNPSWENDAWYSDRWPGGHLPVVQEIKQRAPWPERKPARHRPGTLAVQVENGVGHTVVVRRAPDDHFVADAPVGPSGTASVSGLTAGRYRAEVVGAQVVSGEVDIKDDRVTLTLVAPPRQSRVEGRVQGGEKPLEVHLLVQDDGEERLERRARVRPGEPFTFDRLWAGRYRLRLLSDPPVVTAPFDLDGRNQHRVELVVPRRRWRYRVENPSGQPTNQRRSLLVVVVPEGLGPTVRVTAPWAVLTARVGNKPEINPDAAVLDALPAGTYRVQVEGVPAEVSLSLDGQSTATVFLEPEEVVEAPALGRLRGQLEGQNVAGVEVVLRREGQEHARTVTDPHGTFVFEALPAGRYTVFVPLLNVESTPLDLDGRSEYAFRLPVGAPVGPTAPVEGTSRLRGQLEGRNVAGVEVVLRREGQEHARTVTDPHGIFVFEALPAGRYTVFVPSLNVESTPLDLDGRSEYAFRLPLEVTSAPVSHPAVPAVEEERPISPVLGTYIWLLPGQGDLTPLYETVAPFAVEYGWTLGFSSEPLRLARRAVAVTLGEEPSDVAEGVEVVTAPDLLALSVHLQRLADRWAHLRVQPFGSLRGYLENAPETARAVRLWAGETLVAERPLDEQGRFWFDRLPPGRYVVRPVGVEEVAWPVEVEADEVCELVLVWPGTRSTSETVRRVAALLSLYVLVGRAVRPLANVMTRLVLSYLAATPAVIGFRPQEAAHADAVLILADEQEVPLAVEARLQEAGTQVERLTPTTLADLEVRVRQFVRLFTLSG